MSGSINDILQLASLEIVEYDIHTRKTLSIHDRTFPHYIMSYIKRGEAALKIGDEVYRTGPGSIIIVPPNVKHSHFKDTDVETVFLWWHFDFKIAGIIDAIRILHLPVVSMLANQEAFENMFMNYYSAGHDRETLPNILRRKAFGLNVMAIIFDELIQEKSLYTKAGIPQPFIEILTEITNPDMKDTSLMHFSEKHHLSPTYISNRFKKYFGISPIAMRREVMHERARQLLKSSGLSVGEIALALGYDDAFHFTRAFTTREGASPKQFRNDHRLD